ncbi:MAG: hypothetical protein RMJ97_04045 [Raineya sp.]|nr:hypothetical protein [Raineya sp.]MDW8296035.1 hypothetical protein [Raineya sp.]
MEKIYIKEVNELQRAKQIAEKLDLHEHNLKEEYKRLLLNFEESIGQMRLITKVSDKIQKKLDKANAALDQKNKELDAKNQELQRTINELTQARAGRTATTIVLFLAVVLFLVEEILIEPIIETRFEGNQWTSIGSKLLIVILLKPLESVLENIVLSFLHKRLKKQKASQLVEQSTALTAHDEE